MKPQLFRRYQKLLGAPLFGVIFYDGKLVLVPVKDSIVQKSRRILLLCGGNASRLKQGQNLIEIYKVLVSGLDGWNSTICNQFTKGVFGDLGFGIELPKVFSRLFNASDFTRSIISSIMVWRFQSNARCGSRP